MRKILVAVAGAVAAMTFAPAALGADFTLHGAAEAGIGNVKLVSDFSDGSSANNASWIDFGVPAGLKFSDLTSLSTQFNVTDDDCGGGSPRFQINVEGKNVFVYLGPSPSFTGCTPNTWLSSGNLVGTSDACRVDTSQHQPGTQCSTWAAAVALLGSKTVTSIQLVVDSGWFFVAPRPQTDQEQTVLVRNITINGKTFVTPQTPAKQNPAKLCAAQRASFGPSAFNELWGTNANDRNAFGKCVSTMAKAKKQQSAAAFQSSIMNAAAQCKSRGMRAAELGACISVRDGLRATKADPANKKGRKR